MDAAEEEKVRNLQTLFLVFKLCPLVFSLGHIYWHHTAKPVPAGPTWESIMYLLTDWEGLEGKYLARGHSIPTERSGVIAP